MIIFPFLVVYFCVPEGCLPREPAAFNSIFAVDFYPWSAIERLPVTGQGWFAPFWLDSVKEILNLQGKGVHFFHLCTAWKVHRHKSSPHSAQPQGWLTFLQPWGEAGVFPWLLLASMDMWDSTAAAVGWAGVQVAAGWGKSSVGWVVLSVTCWASASGQWVSSSERHSSLSNDTNSFLAKGKKGREEITQSCMY